jgi:hypothetical protein
MNVVKTMINHSQIHHFGGWYKPSKMGGSYCFNHIIIISEAINSK